MQALLQVRAPTLQQATADPRLHRRLLDSHRQVWVSLLWGHCSFLLDPGAQGSVCALQESVSQSCVSSGSATVGLTATSSKRAMPYPSLLRPDHLPLQRSTADLYIHRRCSNTVLPQSLWGPWDLVGTRIVWALWASLVGMRFDSKCEFASPTILRALLLCPWTWSVSSQLLQCHLTGVSLNLDVGCLLTTAPWSAATAPDLGHGGSLYCSPSAVWLPLTIHTRSTKHWWSCASNILSFTGSRNSKWYSLFQR